MIKYREKGAIKRVEIFNQNIEKGGKSLDKWFLDEPHLNQLSSILYIFFFFKFTNK